MFGLIGPLLWVTSSCLAATTPTHQPSKIESPEHDPRSDLTTLAFTSAVPRPDLYSVPCFACLMEECPEVRRYGANETIWTKCSLGGTLSPAFGDSWFETVDGCYIMHSDFNYYPHWNKREVSADPVCDREKALRLPNITSPQVQTRQNEKPTYVPAIVDPKHDKKCLVCADPLCQIESSLRRNASIELECWTVSTMGPGDVISFPKYDERWVMTKEGCYLALSEVVIPKCDDVKRCLPYCEPPPHYWAPVKDHTLARAGPVNGSAATGWTRDLYVVDFDCWEYGDIVQGNATWYKGTEFHYAGGWYTVWWPKAALGQFGSTGEPPNHCLPEGGNSTGVDLGRVVRRNPHPAILSAPETNEPHGTRAVGHAAPRAVQIVYALVHEVDTRCRLCTKRICPYYTVYQPGSSMDFSCFVYGSVVDGSDIWLKSAEAVRCYVPRRYVTLNGGSSISYCRSDGNYDTEDKRSFRSTDSTSKSPTGEQSPSIAERAPLPQVSDPSQSPDPPKHDSCQNTPERWEELCYNQALACCVKRTEVDFYWDCTSERYTNSWKAACHDLRTQTNCTMAKRLGNQMEGCESGDVYRDPSTRDTRVVDLMLGAEKEG